jgi:hypothetical protein
MNIYYIKILSMSLTINNVYSTLRECIRNKMPGDYVFKINNFNSLNAAFNGMHNTIGLIIKDIDTNINYTKYNFKLNSPYLLIDEYCDVEDMSDLDENDNETDIYILYNKYWYLNLLDKIIIKIIKKNTENNLYIKVYRCYAT